MFNHFLHINITKYKVRLSLICFLFFKNFNAFGVWVVMYNCLCCILKLFLFCRDRQPKTFTTQPSPSYTPTTPRDASISATRPPLDQTVPSVHLGLSEPVCFKEISLQKSLSGCERLGKTFFVCIMITTSSLNAYKVFEVT